MMPLSFAKLNKEYFIERIDDCDEKLRLIEMGFCNCKIRLLRISFGKKDYLVFLRNFKMILRKELVEKIWIKKL